MKNEYAVYIGRFQPFHLGHVHVINEALEHAEQLLIFIGSSNESRTANNPFTFAERCDVIFKWADAEGLLERVSVLHIEDTDTDQEWLEYLSITINSIVRGSKDVTIVGHDKDDSSWYLTAFPQYSNLLVRNYYNLNATCIREEYFLGNNPAYELKPMLPNSTKDFLINFKVNRTKEFRDLCNSTKIESTKVATEYPRIEHTADCIVLGTYEDSCELPYILLIKRKNNPGKGEWALPGGFVEVNETVLASAYRELEEETGVTKGSLTEDTPVGYCFDHPDRDPRGRIITTAFVVELGCVIDDLYFAAKDDAEEAQWFPLSDILLSNLPMFLDHKKIIQHCLREENISTIA